MGGLAQKAGLKNNDVAYKDRFGNDWTVEEIKNPPLFNRDAQSYINPNSKWNNPFIAGIIAKNKNPLGLNGKYSLPQQNPTVQSQIPDRNNPTERRDFPYLNPF